MEPLVIILLWGIFVATFLFVIIRKGIQRDEEFNERFEPISDAEFLARCPGTDPVIALKVRRIVSEHLGVEYDRIHPSARFVEDLGAD